MLVSLPEYGKIHGKSGYTLRRMAEKNMFNTAHKIGRNWVVDSSESYPVKKRAVKRPITVVSLFSGCGGMDLGFVGGFDFLCRRYEKTDFNIIWANEINPAAYETYRSNIGNHIIVGDINEEIANIPEHADVVIGGFPCQDISINGKMLGISGKRSGLYTAIVEAVRKLTPQVFVAENVGGLLLKQNEASLKKILEDFSSLGYEVSCQPYHAEDYGVPQSRERVFLVGTKAGKPKFTPPTIVTATPITAKEAIGDLEAVAKDKEFSHIWSLANVSGEQGNRRLLADRPGYTIRSECHGNIQFHYSLPRRISMREAARIQSFPDTFRFPGKLRETERQIGNAVPPALAWHVARAVEPLIERESV
ncbi:MAG: DNA cytosine methyltransferase [Deltaproteobacteria bacterium]|jgi:DNA (cytosine-5)-methyltransferase 1|nr:DNA cytosine methyltransferase [Deltaproteobacteria bacterium]